MPVIYLILISYSFIASQIHWPFGSVALLLGIFVTLADVIIQLVRLSVKKTSYHVLLLSLSLCFLSVGYAFVWLGWPGMKTTAWICLILAAPGVGLSFNLKNRATFRKILTIAVFAVLAFISLMKESAFYCFKHNMSVDRPDDSPVFVVHRLAYIFYREGDQQQAKKLLDAIRKDLNRKTAFYREERNGDQYMLHIFVEDSTIVSNDIKQMKAGNWSDYQFLIPEDINYRDLK